MDKPGSLDKKLNKHIEKQAGKAGKKLAEKAVHDKLGELDAKTDKHLAGLQEKLNYGMSKSGLNLLASVYFLIFLEHVPVIVFILLIYFFSVILSILLTLVLIIVAIIYLVCYILISRFPGMLKKGSLGFLVALLLSFCEAIFLSYLCSVIGEVLLMVIIAIVMIILLVSMIMAKCMKHRFKAIIGVGFGALIAAAIYAAYMYFNDFSWATIIISYILANIYQGFILIMSMKILRAGEGEEENFKSAVYITLCVYKKKIDYTVGLVFILLGACFKLCKKKDNY